MKNENAEPTIKEVLMDNRKLKIENARLHQAYNALKDKITKVLKILKNG